MNPMQGAQNVGGSATEVNQADGESIYRTDTSHTLNPVDNGFPNNSTSSGRSTYTSSSSHSALNDNWWRIGESSSIAGPSNQVNSNEMKTNHQLFRDGVDHFVGYGSEGRHLGSNGMMVQGGVHAGSHIRNGPSFLLGSSSNPMSQHVNMSMDMDSDGLDAHTSGSLFRHNNCGSSSGSSIWVAGESSSGPASWGSSCKRKALEGAHSPFLSGETPDCFIQAENGSSNAGLAQYGASSSLTWATPSQNSPNVTNRFRWPEDMFEPGGPRTVATNVSHSTRNSDTLSRPGRQLNSRQPQESVAFSISHAGSSVHPTGSSQLNLPLNSPFVAPLDLRSTSVTGGSRTGENQTNIHQFSWDASSSSRATDIGIHVERFGRQWETLRSNSEQPTFAPATEIRSIWSSSISSPSIPQPGGSSSASHALQPNPTWIPPPRAPSHNPSRISELSSWSLFPNVESQSDAPNISSTEVAMPSGSNNWFHRSRQRRLGLISERHNDLLRLRQLERSLAADSDGRNQLISEIHQVLSAMRRGEALQNEDYMVFDPLIYQGITEMHDRHREMRLDVDNMSYEELLALGERIGDVSTGLKEDVIMKAMKQHTHPSSSTEFHQVIEPCCICQEEYAEGDHIGTLECGHEFHKDCIKQWVMLKNLCPICKTMALTTS